MSVGTGGLEARIMQYSGIGTSTAAWRWWSKVNVKFGDAVHVICCRRVI